MTDLSITAASVLPGAGAEIVHGTAGAAITAGQVVYRDADANTWKLADNDSATAAVRLPHGFALNGAASGQPIAVEVDGDITLGAVLTAGTAYYLSSTAGGICPVADLASGDYPCLLGIAESTSVLRIGIQPSDVAL